MTGEPVRGTVQYWNDEEGWGVLVSPEVPGEVWAHYSLIHSGNPTEYLSLTPGETVLFTWEEFDQDGYTFRAVRIRRPGDTSPDPEQDTAADEDDSMIDVRIVWDDPQ